MDFKMDVSIRQHVSIRPYIDNGDHCQPRSAESDASGLISSAQSERIGHTASRDNFPVIIITTDFLVQIQKLIGADFPGVQSGKSVLHSDVVDGAPGKTRRRIAPVDIN